MNAGVLTVSDRRSRGEGEDEGGPLVERMITDAGATVVVTGIVPDERADIERVLTEWCARGDIDLILTTGGTGLGPRDVTPEATLAVIDKEAQGIAEAMRAACMKITAFAALSRQICGIKGSTLILNLPGSPKAAAECLEAVSDILPHAVEMMR